jgi:hypothetical protein
LDPDEIASAEEKLVTLRRSLLELYKPVAEVLVVRREDVRRHLGGII